MDCEGNEFPGVRVDNTTAENSSPDWTEASSGRRRSGRRLGTAVASRDSLGSRSGTQRVLRTRAVVVPDGVNDSLDTTPRNKNPPNVQHRVGRAAGSRSRKAPVTQSEKKKPSTSMISKLDVGPKPSKSRKDKGRSRSKSSCTTFKSETETAASSGGEDFHDAEGINENGKSRCRTSMPQMEVKKEESDQEDEEEDQKGTEKEGSTQAVVQIEDGAGDNAETSRKESRRNAKAPRQPKRRKKPPVQYVRCDVDGCGTILAHPRYLQHHIKYQHLLKKKYVCDHPSCGRLFRLQKQLLRHAKHHTDQRDYICEYCARAFKSSYNLAVHRMIHTGEKPIQCEICGFTCRQKASLNWHMKKHDVEASYQFSCSICGKKFEKKDSVVAHKAKIHPKVLIAEAMAGNGGSVIRISAPVISQPERPSISRKQQRVTDGMQQVALPPATQAQVDVPQNQFLQLPLQVACPQQAPALLHLAAAPPDHLYTGPPQPIQLSPLPSGTVASIDSQSTLLTLSSVSSLAPPQVAHWQDASHSDKQIPGEGELWDRVVVGEDIRHAEEIIWEGNERRKENDGIVWEQEGERHILLQCAEVTSDNLM